MNWTNPALRLLGLGAPSNSKPCNEDIEALQQEDALYLTLEWLYRKLAAEKLHGQWEASQSTTNILLYHVQHSIHEPLLSSNRLHGSQGETFLYQAVRHRKPEIFAELVKKGGDPFARNKQGDTPLHRLIYEYFYYRDAASDADEKIIFNILKIISERYVLQINAANSNGETLLHTCLKHVDNVYMFDQAYTISASQPHHLTFDDEGTSHADSDDRLSLDGSLGDESDNEVISDAGSDGRLRLDDYRKLLDLDRARHLNLRLKLFDYLLEIGVDPNRTSKKNENALHCFFNQQNLLKYSKEKYTNTLQALLGKMLVENLYAISIEGSTPLRSFVSCAERSALDDKEYVKELYDRLVQSKVDFQHPDVKKDRVLTRLASLVPEDSIRTVSSSAQVSLKTPSQESKDVQSFKNIVSQEKTSIQDLPTELLKEILQSTQFSNYYSISATCRFWRVLVNDYLVWKKALTPFSQLIAERQEKLKGKFYCSLSEQENPKQVYRKLFHTRVEAVQPSRLQESNYLKWLETEVSAKSTIEEKKELLEKESNSRDKIKAVLILAVESYRKLLYEDDRILLKKHMQSSVPFLISVVTNPDIWEWYSFMKTAEYLDTSSKSIVNHVAYLICAYESDHQVDQIILAFLLNEDCKNILLENDGGKTLLGSILRMIVYEDTEKPIYQLVLECITKDRQYMDQILKLPQTNLSQIIDHIILRKQEGHTNEALNIIQAEVQFMIDSQNLPSSSLAP